ncbi:LPS-assembly lipoprotein LptE [Kaarinaea lacus]
MHNSFITTVARLLVGAALLLVLQSCGFHLRGSVDLPPEIHQLAIDDVTTTSQIATELRIQLRRQDIRLLDNVDDAKLVIVIDAERHQRRVMTVSPEGQVQEFELIYIVNYAIHNKDNQEASISNQNLTIRRGLRFDETAVLGKTSEETRLQQDMVRAAAEQVLRRLQKVSTGQTAKSS